MSAAPAQTYDGTAKPLERAMRDLQATPGSPVPPEWTAAMAHLHAAQVARDCYRNPEASAQMRDDATVQFGREIEYLFDAMAALREKGGTGAITAMLCKKGR